MKISDKIVNEMLILTA